MPFNTNLFQTMLDTTIQKDILSSMNPQIQAKQGVIPVIARYIQSIPFVQSPPSYYGPNVYADRQTVKDHFCSFWKRELGLSSEHKIELGKIFDQNITAETQFASNTSYLIFVNESTVLSVQSMEDAIFDALNLAQ